jgi:hypothetical protein
MVCTNSMPTSPAHFCGDIMKHLIFCFLAGTLVAGCLVSAQSRRDGNFNVAVANDNSWIIDANANTAANMANAPYDVENANVTGRKSSPLGGFASTKLLYEVCGNPRLGCGTSGDFRPEDLPIRIKGEVELFAEYRSKVFFGVILETREMDLDDEECANRFSEEQRIAVQELFPDNKVFTYASGCANFAKIYEHSYNTSAVGSHLLALYGGATEVQAKAVLKKVLATKRFPDAEVEKMQAVLCVACP